MARKYIRSGRLLELMQHVNAGYFNTMSDYQVALLEGKISATNSQAFSDAMNSYTRFLKNNQPEVPAYCDTVTITMAKTVAVFQPFLIPSIAKCFSDFETWQLTNLYQSILLFYRGYYKGLTGQEPQQSYDEDSRVPESITIPEFDDFIKAPAKAVELARETGLEAIQAAVPEELKRAVGLTVKAAIQEKRRQESLLRTGLVVAGLTAGFLLIREVRATRGR